MSANSTTNDVVFVIGANGYSTIGTLSPVQEAMPSNHVFEQYQAIFGHYSVLSAAAHICRYAIPQTNGVNVISRQSPMRSYIDVDGSATSNELEYANLLTYKLTTGLDLHMKVDQPRYNDAQAVQTLPTGSSGAGNRTVYNKPAVAVARWDVPYYGADEVAWVHMRMTIRFSGRK